VQLPDKVSNNFYQFTAKLKVVIEEVNMALPIFEKVGYKAK